MLKIAKISQIIDLKVELDQFSKKIEILFLNFGNKLFV